MDFSKREFSKGFKFWLLVWGLGLVGQLCWNIENQWFNTFVYAKIAKNSTIVTLMVITSALVTTFSTFFFGTFSDRSGTRRKFVSIGYIIWGIFTIIFGLTEFTGKILNQNPGKYTWLAALLVILADDIMSFFGSLGNDCGYNAWINDMTTDNNRGQIGASLATQPVIATIVGTIVGGFLIGTNDNYQRLFWTMGIFVISMGFLSLFVMKDSPYLKPYKDGSFWNQFSKVFTLKNFPTSKELILVCVTTALFFIPFNVYFVHMGNWLIYYMSFTPDKMGLIEGIGLILAMFLTIPAAILINKKRTPIVSYLAIFMDLIGVFTISFLVKKNSINTVNVFSLNNLTLFIGVFFAGSGYILITQSMTMWLKQLYPENSRGQFEGIRIVFFTLLPMIIGTIIGNIVVKNGAGTTINAYGIKENIPTSSIFTWSGILLFPSLIPLFFAAKSYYKRIK
ncbi:MAG: MFS transporter [Spirochaetota bacterium]